MRIKKLHVFMIGSYLGPFLLTFLISLFILLMQFLWKYIDELVGKGLEWHVIAELLFYASASLVAMALPLAVLVSSIMTFGNLGEHYELVALRSAGISLWRIMSPLILLTGLLSVMAFYFSNNLLPIANLKMGTLLYDIRHQKPTMNLRPGIFYRDIEGFAIRVASKGEDDQQLYKVLIYDHTKNNGNMKVITADSARMEFVGGDRYLQMTLWHGVMYEQLENRERESASYPHTRQEFSSDIIRFDLSGFELTRSNEDIFKDNYKMQSLGQLSHNIDTLRTRLDERKGELAKNLSRNFKFFVFNVDSVKVEGYIPVNLLQMFSTEQRPKVAEAALNMARSSKAYVRSATEDHWARNNRINRYLIEVHRKFTLSIACIILFFIGAPLGAIIRKGGLGLPVVVSIAFFLIYYVISITGEKFAKEGLWPVWKGMWMSSLVLLPLGMWLTYKATTDSSLFNLDAYTAPIRALAERMRQRLGLDR